MSLTVDDAGGPVDYLLACPEAATRSELERLGMTGAVPFVAILGAVPAPRAIRLLSKHADAVVLADDRLARSLPVALSAVDADLHAFPRALRQVLERPALTSREKQVLAMVVLDLPNAQIGERLHLTEASIKNVLTTAFAKLGVRSRSAAAQLILDREAGLGPGILRITEAEDEVS